VAKKKQKNKKRKITEKKKRLLHHETKKGILVISLFTLAVLSLLSFFNAAGIVGHYFFEASRLLFGKGFFLVTLSFVLAGLAILWPRFQFKKEKKPVYQTIFCGVILFILSILGIFHILSAPLNDSSSGVAFIGLDEMNAGGYLGAIFGYPLLRYLGFWAGLVVLISLFLISILITFNLPLIFSKRDELEAKEKAVVQEPLRATDGWPKEKKGLWQGLKEKVKVRSGKKDDFLESQTGRTAENGLGSGDIKKLKKLREKDIQQKEELRGKSEVIVSAVSFKKEKGGFKLPPLDLLEKDRGKPTTGDIKADINIIKQTLKNFGIEVEMAEVNVGPTVTQYTLRPAQGVKLSKITALQNDLALALAAHPLRIEAPIPGRSLVGVEIPNRSVVLVRLRNLLEKDIFQKAPSRLTFALGRDAAGNPMFADLAKMPHLLVAGATGTGKTIALNNLITCLLYRNFPEELRFILIDPKRVELIAYEGIPHLLAPVITQPEKAVGALSWAVNEMERRFSLLQEARARDIESYNRSLENMPKNSSTDEDLVIKKPLAYLVIVIDELADLMSAYGREVEAKIVRLAQMARAVGIHLVVSTQRPSVEVITGLIKANITSRMAFQVASQIDSRTILDMAGAEKLLGNGDMLFLSGDSAKPRRIQGAYISEVEVRKVTEYLKRMGEPEYEEEVVIAGGQIKERGVKIGEREAEDELYDEAKEVVIQSGKASASLLQRRLRIGYARAARLLDILEERGIVGPADGAKPREVFVEKERGEDELYKD